MLWRVVYESMSLLGRRYRDLLHDYNKYFTGQDREEARWKSCVDLVSQQLNIATSSMYVRHYFRETSRNKVGSAHRRLPAAEHFCSPLPLSFQNADSRNRQILD